MLKKKQSFITRRKEDGDVTAMNFYHGAKGNSSPICYIAVALKASQAELPAVVIHDKNDHSNKPLVLSHLPSNVNVSQLCFVHKAKFLAILVELEPRQTYNLSVWVTMNPPRKIFDENLKGCFNRIDNCQVENALFTVTSEKGILVYQTEFKGEQVTPLVDKSQSMSAVIELEPEDVLVDHCWLKGENKLIVTSRQRIFIFDGLNHEKTIEYEFPGLELKRLIKDKPSEVAVLGKYSALEYLIDYLNPTGDTVNKRKRPDFLEEAVKEVRRDNPVPFDTLRDDKKREVFLQLYRRFSKDVLKDKKVSISCICRQENGFALGFKGVGMISVFKKSKEGFFLDSTSVIRQREIASICSMAASQDDNHIVCSGKLRPQLGRDPGEGSLEIFIFNSTLVNTIKNSSLEPFEFLYPHGAHFAGIVDSCVVPSKSIVATMSRDKTFKIWNYSGDQKQIFSKDFATFETSKSHKFSFDIHPLSVQVAIGFSKGLWIYYLVEGDLEIAYENREKPCTAVSYSSRGHLLAVCLTNEIQIIDPYSFQVFHRMSSSESISISWIGRDRYLSRLCTNSNFNIWDTWDNYRSEFEDSMIKWASKFHAIAYDPEFNFLVCCCSDSYARIYTRGKVDPYAEFEAGDGVIFTSVLISKKLQVIFFGTNLGAVRIYLWPPIKIDRQFHTAHINIHSGPITTLKISPNYEYLITSSEDASIYFLKITEIRKGENVSPTDALNGLTEQKDTEIMSRISNAFSLNEFSLLSNAKQREMFKKMNELESELQNKITEIDEKNEIQTADHNLEIQRRETENQELLRAMNIELATKMDEEGSKQKKLELECKELEKRLKERIKEKEESHRSQLLALYEERDRIEKEMEEFRRAKDKDLNEATKKFSNIQEQLQVGFEKNKQSINKKYAQAIFYLKEDQKKFQEALKQTEDEYKTLIETKEQSLQTELKAKKKLTEQIRSKYSKLLKDNQKNKERLENLDKLITETKTQNSQLTADIDSFKEKYREMENRLNEQEKVINQKESKIKEYRNKNFHLQNFKSVYDYQVTTLKEAHEPLTEYVDNLEVG